MRQIVIIIVLVFSSILCHAQQHTTIGNMRVEYKTTPLGVEEQRPRFSWQMLADSTLRGCYQTAYRIVVTDPNGNVCWDTQQVKDSHSLNIKYQGSALQAETRYTWKLTVWNQDNLMSSQESWFETGLMCLSDKDAAWKGARWIGVEDSCNVLFSHYLPVFKLGATIQLDNRTKSHAAALLLGVNDNRLMDKNKNIYHLQNDKDSSFIKVEIDTKGLDNNQAAYINVYRKGYAPTDVSSTPFKRFTIPLELLNQSNRYAPHSILMEVNLGETTILLDGDTLGKVVLNPIGHGGDFLAFPVLGDVGIFMQKGQVASFSDITVFSYRQPCNPLATLTRLNGKYKEGLYVMNPSRNSMPMFRTQFHVNKKIKQARLYMSARGVYDAYLNGKKIGQEFLSPGWTQYNKTLMYQTYDITSYLHEGENAMGTILGEGWWSGAATYQGDNWNYYGDKLSLLARVNILYEDGTSQDIVSSPSSWQCYVDGAIRYSSLFQGEVYDAMRETAIADWTTSHYDSSQWQPCTEVTLQGHVGKGKWGDAPSPDDYSDFKMLSQIGDGIVAVDTLTAQSVKEVKKGVFVYDMGQNMVGVPSIQFSNLHPSSQISIRYAEVLYPNLEEYAADSGMVMMENIRAAMAQDIYIAKGGEETFSPHFTYHGFRYMEVTGIDEALPLSAVKGIVWSSVKKTASHYTTSNQLVNRLWENIKWSTMGNFLSVPTDCPQRNERMGWSGDISVFSRTATYMTDAAPFLRKHLLAMRDVQSKEGKFQDIAPLGGGFGGLLWGSAGITVPWECYQQYNDTLMLSEHYDAMKKYLSYVRQHYIDPKTGIIVQNRQWGDLGDWLGLEDSKNDKSLLWETYYIYDLQIMVKVATLLGNQEDATMYEEMLNQRVDFFNATYIDTATGKTIASSFNKEKEGKTVDIQTSYALPLAFDIVKSHTKEKFIENFKQTLTRENTTDNGHVCSPYSLLTGFIGTAWISKALSDIGETNMAYRLLRQTDYPSWLYPVTQGATTIWERLNSYTKERGFGGNNRMNSFNHYSFGAVGAWMYNYSLGIMRDEQHPGFKHFILQPQVDEKEGIQYAQGYYDSMYGRIESQWQRKENSIIYTFHIPANTSATVCLPASTLDNISIGGLTRRERNKYLRAKRKIDGNFVFEIPSGTYRFTIVQ